MAGTTQVIVVGGGYAGVMAANRLTQRGDLAVTLINPRPQFVERIRLHQLVGGSHPAVVDYREVLADGVQLRNDTVTRIDPTPCRVVLASGDTVTYDYLIYAVGSGSAAASVPGVAEFAHPVATLEGARRLRRALDTAPATAPVTVVGGGATGIEVAAELAEAGWTVTLVCGEVLGPYLHPRGRRVVAKRLAALGVTVLDGPDAKVTAVTGDKVRLRGGRTLPSTVTAWATGFGVPDLAVRSGLTTDPLGRLLTDETLTSVDDPRIVAAGDAAAPSGLPLRMSCQAAHPLGAHAADTVLARIAGEQPATIDIGFFGQCLALGRRAAIDQFATRDDTANRFFVSGRLIAVVKERACRLAVGVLVKEARKPGAFVWRFKDRTRQRLLQARSGEKLATH